MKNMRSSLAWLVTGASALALAGCGGGGNGSSTSMPSGAPSPAPSPAPTSSAYTVKPLVSNVPGMTSIQDANLSHGWGIAFAPGTAVWVNDHGSNKSTLYDGDGNIQPLVVNIPAATSGSPSGPTGIVANTTSGFAVSAGGVTAAATFIFDGTGGTISGWAQNVDNANAITEFDGSAEGDVFTGLAIFSQGSTNLLLAANAGTGNVDVFDSSYKKTSLAGGFKDSNLPSGYKPFGIQVIGSQIYVSYAHFTPGKPIEDHGAGLGFIDIFDATGTLVKRLVDTGGALNAPWGMVVAPAGFGQFSNDLLVGNFGDGKINVYDPATGASIGVLNDSGGNPVTIPGLWGIAFGNGAFNQPTTTLYYAAGPTATQGVYGRIDLGGPAAPSPSPTPTPTPTPTPPPPGGY